METTPFDLKSEREKRPGLRQEDIAEGVGVAQPTVSNWEAGHKRLRGPALRQVKAFLVAYDRKHRKDKKDEFRKVSQGS